MLLYRLYSAIGSIERKIKLLCDKVGTEIATVKSVTKITDGLSSPAGIIDTEPQLLI